MSKAVFAILISAILGVGLLSFPEGASALLPSGSLSAVGATTCELPCSVTLNWSASNTGGAVSIKRNGDLIPSASGLSESGTTSIALVEGANTFRMVSASPPQEFGNEVGAVGTVAATLASCNQACGGSNPSCQSGLTCYNGFCRLPNFENETNCTAPTVTTTLQCNAVCGGANTQCQSGLTCININGTNRCRLAGFYDRDNCQGDGVASVTPVLGAVSTTKKIVSTPLSGASPTPEATTSTEVLGQTVDEFETPEPANPPAGGELPPLLSIGGIAQRVKQHPVEAGLVTIGIGGIGTLLYFGLKALLWEPR